VSSIVDAEELEVLVFLELASGLSVNHPVLVLSIVEFGLATPCDGIGPCLTASPVANEIFVARVNENLQAAFQDTLNLGSEVGEPISEELSVNFLVALYPFARGRDIQLCLNCIVVKELVGATQVVAKGRLVALLSYVINIESRSKRVSENNCHGQLAELEGLKPVLFWIIHHSLALNKASLECKVHLFVNQTVLMSELGILRILHIRIDPTVSDSNTLEIEAERARRDFLNKVISKGRNVMPGVALTSDIEIATLIFGVLFKEAIQEQFHCCSDLILIGVEVKDACALRESSTNGLVYEQQVRHLIP
jgi:hypothetical protein